MLQGVQAWPTNVTLQRFLELHIEITGELPDPTSGQIMERCAICSEKSYCTLCGHCDKKCCPECKDAHMDILRREISRLNHQVNTILKKFTYRVVNVITKFANYVTTWMIIADDKCFPIGIYGHSNPKFFT